MSKLEQLITERNSLWNGEEGRLFMLRFCLQLLDAYGQGGFMLEIGVDRGSVPIFLAESFRSTKMASFYDGVDPSPRLPFHVDRFRDFATFHQMKSETFWLTRKVNEAWNLIYIDGCHDEDVAALDVRSAVPRLGENGVLLVHDTRDDGGPRRAFIKECLGNPEMTGFLNDAENVCRTGMAIGFRRGSVWD